MTLPSQLTAAMGMSEGDYLEASFVEGKIVLAPTMVIDRSGTPVANSEFSKAERRAIDAKLVKSDEDIGKGRVYGPFSTGKEMAASVESQIRKLRLAKRKPKVTCPEPEPPIPSRQKI